MVLPGRAICHWIPPINWTQDPEAFERAFQAACTLLIAAQPQETPSNPASSDLGWAFTNDFMQAMRGHKPDYAAMEQAADIKRLLGPIAERMRPEYARTNPTRSPTAGEMAPRSNWKGELKLSLVSAPIAIYPATSSSEKVGFNTLNPGTGNSQVEDDELAEIGIDSPHTLNIEKFVPKISIDDRYRDTPYYLVPEDGQQAFAVIRDAMKSKKMVAIARVVMAYRERFLILEPFGKGIMGTLLHYPYEIRSDEAVFQEIQDRELPDQMIQLAEHIVDKMSGDFQPDKLENRYYDEAMIEFMRSKQADLAAPKKATAQPSNVINLMDALRRSIEAA